MLEIDLKPATKDISDWQNRINTLSRLGEIELQGHNVHELMEKIDTTQNHTIVQTVEQIIYSEKPKNV